MRIRTELKRVAGPLAVLTVPALIAVVFYSSHADLAIRLWLVAVGALALWLLAGATMAVWPVASPTGVSVRWPRRRTVRPERLRQLEELEHAVDFSLGTAFDLHFRLRPHLVRIAEHRLAARGVRLATQPERARALVGPRAWELVRPDRPGPANRAAPGADLRTLRSAVEELDAI